MVRFLKYGAGLVVALVLVLNLACLLSPSLRAQIQEGDLKIVLVDAPLQGGGNETTGHVKLNTAKLSPTLDVASTLGTGTFGAAGVLGVDLNELADLVAVGNATAAAGTSNEAARADHRHAATYGEAADLGSIGTTAAATGTGANASHGDHRHTLNEAQIEGGNGSINPNTATVAITFETAASDSSYAVVASLTVDLTTTENLSIESKTTSGFTARIGELVGTTATFDWHKLDVD
ncbi:MAG: hypothetical protein AABY75_05400 [Bacteroidota bacterium]